MCIKTYIWTSFQKLSSKTIDWSIYEITHTHTFIHICMCIFFFSNVTRSLCISWAFFPGKCRASSQLPESALKPSSFPPQDGLLASPIIAHGPNKFPKMSNGCTLVLVRLASFYDWNEVSKSPLGNAWAPRGEFKYKYSSNLPFLILFLKNIIMTGQSMIRNTEHTLHRHWP